jgi:hypothetical protein
MISGLSTSNIFTSTFEDAIFDSAELIFSISRPFLPIKTPGLEVLIVTATLSE